MIIKKNAKGMALLVTLILSFVALGFIAAILYLVNTSTGSSGSTKRYFMALETAKGVSDYVIGKILSEELSCVGGGGCDSGDEIVVEITPPDHDVYAEMLSDPKTFTYNGVDYTVYSIRITAKNKNTNDIAKIEFVYRVY